MARIDPTGAEAAIPPPTPHSRGATPAPPREPEAAGVLPRDPRSNPEKFLRHRRTVQRRTPLTTRTYPLSYAPLP